MQRDVNEKVGGKLGFAHHLLSREVFFFFGKFFLGADSHGNIQKILVCAFFFFFNGEESLIIKFWIWKNFYQMGISMIIATELDDSIKHRHLL